VDNDRPQIPLSLIKKFNYYTSINASNALNYRIAVRALALHHLVVSRYSIAVGAHLRKITIKAINTSLAIITFHKSMRASFGESSFLLKVIN